MFIKFADTASDADIKDGLKKLNSACSVGNHTNTLHSQRYSLIKNLYSAWVAEKCMNGTLADGPWAPLIDYIEEDQVYINRIVSIQSWSSMHETPTPVTHARVRVRVRAA